MPMTPSLQNITGCTRHAYTFFAVIGAQKGGTTSLAQHLNAHEKTCAKGLLRMHDESATQCRTTKYIATPAPSRYA